MPSDRKMFKPFSRQIGSRSEPHSQGSADELSPTEAHGAIVRSTVHSRAGRRQFLFIHPNFPGQFGLVLSRLATDTTVECMFLSTNVNGMHGKVHCVPFKPKSGATAATHYCSLTFENGIWSACAVYETCGRRSSVPASSSRIADLGVSVFLRELYRCPIVNLFEYFYHARYNDMGFRQDFPSLRAPHARAQCHDADGSERPARGATLRRPGSRRKRRLDRPLEPWTERMPRPVK